MAEDRTSEAAPAEGAKTAAAAGGFKTWLPLIITVIAMPVLAFAMTQFVLVPQIQKSLNASGANTNSSSISVSKLKKEGGKEKTETVAMNKLLVNVAGTMGARYLLVSLSIVGTSANFKDEMTSRDAQMRDAACSILGSKTLADLEKPGERNLIRNELLTSFNGILGDSTVQDIYFPEFAIQ